jgi:hypothetical protein
VKRNASSIGLAILTTGKALSTESDTVSQSQYFATGNAQRRGINSYELIATAEAASFSMALANQSDLRRIYPSPNFFR